MPELPEVETTCRGIKPIIGQPIKEVIIRQAKLRYPISTHLQQLAGSAFETVSRRGKYLLLATSRHHVIIHLGMSGCLRLVSATQAANKHDHVDIVFCHGQCLRYHDPRRFGAIIWTDENPHHHPLLQALGPEPLSSAFNGDYLYQQSRSRRVAIKSFIMNSRIVVGVGNIYANEALFTAGIQPTRAAGDISFERYQLLIKAIKNVLRAAILQGGTTLKDFKASDGKPGYFKQQLQVYGRGGEKCVKCDTLLTQIRQAQRTSVFCSHCQH